MQFPGLPGVLPGYGGQRDNAWGYGFEIRAGKRPHWTSERNSAASYGHFGQSGTMFWVDPVARLGLVALADRPFGDWASAGLAAAGRGGAGQLRLSWPARALIALRANEHD